MVAAFSPEWWPDSAGIRIQQPDYQAARNYWKVLKNRLRKEGSESVTKCNRLKMEAGRKGGGIAKKARKELEAKTGRKVVTGDSFLPPGSAKELGEGESATSSPSRPAPLGLFSRSTLLGVIAPL